MTQDEAFRILGVLPGADRSQIRQAYRDLAKVWHPDRFEKDPRLNQLAQERLKQINQAYALVMEASGKLKQAGTYGPSESRKQGQSKKPAFVHPPVSRFLARLADWLAAFLVFFASGLGFWLLDLGVYWWLLPVAATLAWVPVEALFLCLLEATFGKWIMGISVVDSGFYKLKYSAALKRGFHVWWRGAGLGFLPLAVLTMTAAYIKMANGDRLAWDKGFFLIHGPADRTRLSFGLVVLLVMLVFSPHFFIRHPLEKPAVSKSPARPPASHVPLRPPRPIPAAEGRETDTDKPLELADLLPRTPDPLSDPDDGFFYNQIGKAYLDLGFSNLAARAFQQAVRVNPRLVPAYRNLAVSLCRSGKTAKAARVMESVVRQNKNDGKSRHLLGLIYLVMGNKKSAMAMYLELTVHHPDLARHLLSIIQEHKPRPIPPDLLLDVQIS